MIIYPRNETIENGTLRARLSAPPDVYFLAPGQQTSHIKSIREYSHSSSQNIRHRDKAHRMFTKALLTFMTLSRGKVWSVFVLARPNRVIDKPESSSKYQKTGGTGKIEDKPTLCGLPEEPQSVRLITIDWESSFNDFILVTANSVGEIKSLHFSNIVFGSSW